MKFSIDKESFHRAFQIAADIVPSRTPREILKNVQCSTKNGLIVLVASDGDGVSIRSEIQNAQIEKEGCCLLPAAKVKSILAETSSGSFELENESTGVTLVCGSSEFRLAVEDPVDFPPSPVFTDKNFHVIAPDVLKKLISRTIFATDAESTRYSLGGIFMEVNPGLIHFVATDSRRLTIANSTQITAEGTPDRVNDPVVPRRAMALLEKSLTNQPVHFSIRPNDVVFRTGLVTIASQLLQGRFPDYRKVLPTKSTINIELVNGPFLSAVRQSIVMTSEETRGVDLTFDQGLLTLESASASVGKSRIDLPIPYNGKKFVVRFDPRYLQDFLRTLDTSAVIKVSLEKVSKDEDGPGMFSIGDEYRYVLMPLDRNA